MTQKLALVTGGLHRVGAAISARLARELRWSPVVAQPGQVYEP